MKQWIVIQLGSREHYAIPRALYDLGQLGTLMTDTWIPRRLSGLLRKIAPALAQRRHDGIPDQKVRSSSVGRIGKDLALRAAGRKGWCAIFERNDWFQQWAAKQVRSVSCSAGDVLFSYSYTARLPFREAKRRGMFCVLGQIDPGPLEQEIVEEATAQYNNLKLGEDYPPAEYWESWREELELADRIVVNSPWSSDLLIRQGVPEDKIRIIPLAYEGSLNPTIARSPEERTGSQVLTVLFLGQVILRKGVGQLFDAIRLLRGEVIRFIIAGPLGVKVPPDIASNPAVQVLGSVDRNQARELYRKADVFLLPTLSDGFAITQLEALAHGIPVIASKFCGAVISHGVDGLLLDEVTPEGIVEALIRALRSDELTFWKKNITLSTKYSLSALGTSLQDLKSND